MARNEADKEDLIADATALIERAEYCHAHTHSTDKIVTVGFRRDDSLSLYFDQDPFYQFTSDGLLRRAYENGFLYRSQQDTLSKLNRIRNAQQTTLNKTDLNSTELDDFQQRMLQRLNSLLDLLQSGDYNRPRCVSERGDLDQRTIIKLRNIVQQKNRFWSRSIAVRK